MKIAVIGAGNVGAALGKGWLKAGHDLVFGVRDAQSPKTIKALGQIPGALLKPVAEAAHWAETLVLAVPPDAVLALIPQLGDLTHKTVIDATNAVRVRPEPFQTAYHALQAMGKAAHVVKCFNSTGAENLADPVYQGSGIDMFMAGDSSQGLLVAEQLAKDLGFANCHRFGGSDKVLLLEQFALCWINLAIGQGHGRGVAFRLLNRQQAS